MSEINDDVIMSESADIIEIRKYLLGKQSSNADVQRSNLMDLSEEMLTAFTAAGAIEPPIDPLSLVRLVGMSGILRPLIDAMAVNIHGYGYHFDSIIDLDASDAFDRVKAAIQIEKEHKAEIESVRGEEPQKINISDNEVSERIESLREQSRKEWAKLSVFFKNASRKISFARMSRKLQVDKESTGYGVLEVLRDGRGEVSRLNHAQSWTFRALPLGKVVEQESRIRATDISYRTIKEESRFRRFVQVYEGRTVYFKEFGDARVMSAMTGKYYKDERQLLREEEKSKPATEVLWFSLDSSESDLYGSVRWSGCIPGVIGSREQAEVNLLFFRSKAIPPMVVLVSGGRLAKGARKQLEAVIEREIKGVSNFHKILVIEAEPVGTRAGNAAAGLPSQDKVKIELKPLTDSIFKDALWLGYADANRHELGQSFRLPPMMRGDTEKLNRATAKIAREATEQMVFGPERKDFEFDINRTLLADMGIMLWEFRLNTPETTDAEQLAQFVKDLSDGILSVNESRRIASKIFKVELPPINADWARMPMRFSLAGFEPEPLPEEEEEDDNDNKQENTSMASEHVRKIRISQEIFDNLVVIT